MSELNKIFKLLFYRARCGNFFDAVIVATILTAIVMIIIFCLVGLFTAVEICLGL